MENSVDPYQFASEKLVDLCLRCFKTGYIRAQQDKRLRGNNQVSEKFTCGK